MLNLLELPLYHSLSQFYSHLYSKLLNYPPVNYSNIQMSQTHHLSHSKCLVSWHQIRKCLRRSYVLLTRAQVLLHHNQHAERFIYWNFKIDVHLSWNFPPTGIIRGSWEAIFRVTNDWNSNSNTSHNKTSHNNTWHDNTSHNNTSHNNTSHTKTSHNNTSHNNTWHDNTSLVLGREAGARNLVFFRMKWLPQAMTGSSCVRRVVVHVRISSMRLLNPRLQIAVWRGEWMFPYTLFISAFADYALGTRSLTASTWPIQSCCAYLRGVFIGSKIGQSQCLPLSGRSALIGTNEVRKSKQDF